MLKDIGSYIEFLFEKPFKNVKSINDIILDGDVEIPNVLEYIVEFRYSFDDDIYCAWIPANNNYYSNIQLKDGENIWVQIRITLIKNENNIEVVMNVPDISFVYYIEDMTQYYDAVKSSLYNIRTGINQKYITNDITENAFKPYDLNPAVFLYNELSESINNLFGWEIMYWRSIPDKKNKDVYLNEYNLYNVDGPKCMNVLVNMNEFPDNKINFDMLDLGYEKPFEIHIVKTYFQTMWGSSTSPKKGDILYFPQINRMFEIISMYLYKGFMNTPTYFKISLIKYQNKTNTNLDIESKEFIDNITRSSDEIFGHDRKLEAEELIKEQQYTQRSWNKDELIEYFNIDLDIIDSYLNNNHTIISEHYYNLFSIYNKNNNILGVKYKPKVFISEVEDISFSMWFKLVEPYKGINNKIKEIIVNQNDLNDVTIITENPNYYKQDIEIIIDNKKNTVNSLLIGYYKILNIIDEKTFKIRLIDNSVQNFDNIIQSLTIRRIEPVTLLTSKEDGSNGVKIQIIENNNIRLTVNDNVYYNKIDVDLDKELWYGMIINISNKFKQVTINVWKMKYDNNNKLVQSTNLDMVYENVLNDVENVILFGGENLSLISGRLNITNIRVLKQFINVEKQQKILNQSILKDANNIVIIDNAKPRLKLQKFTNPL